MDSKIIGGLIVLFVGIIVAFAILPAIAEQTTAMTTKNPFTENFTIPRTLGVPNETVQLTVDANNVPSGWKVDDCPIDSFVLTEADGTALTIVDDYQFTPSTGALFINNTVEVRQLNATNDTIATYNFCIDGYNKDAGARGISNLIPIVMALAIFGFVVFYAIRKSDFFK